MLYLKRYLSVGILCFSCASPKERFVDEDEDGFALEDGDCNDEDATIHPHAEEICDGLDNNCNQEIDEDSRSSTVWYQDADGDGFGGTQLLYSCQQPIGFISQSGDCDDNNPHIHPQGEESILNIGVDNQCDGNTQQEEYDMHKQESLPPSISQVYVENFLYLGPTVFLLDDDRIHRISYGSEEITYEQESIFEPWVDIYQGRSSELWYSQHVGNQSFRMQEYLTGQRITSPTAPSQIGPLDQFMGDGLQYNAVLFHEASSILYYPRTAMDVEESAMSLMEQFELPALTFQEVLDVNGDGYGELWVSLPDQGKLIYGGSTGINKSVWSLHYDDQGTCTHIKIIAWDDDPHVVCQNADITIHELGPPDSTSSLNEAEHLYDGVVSSMTAIDHYIFLQEQDEGKIQILSSKNINPTTINLDQGNSNLYISAQTDSQTYILSALEKSGYALTYETIGLSIQTD